jgi:hypothetical protein
MGIRRCLIKLCAVAALITLTSVQASAQTSAAMEFPRLAISPIGSPHDYENPQRQRHYARYDLVTLSIWPGWDWHGTSMETVVKNIKTINPKTRVFLYVINMEFDVGGNPGSSPWRDWYNALNANTWWLYTAGTTGARVNSGFGPTHMVVNTTPFSPRNAAGENVLDFFARYTVDLFLRPNPSVDGFNLDNVFWKPRVNGDWNRDGLIDDQNSPEVQRWVREGYKAQVEAFRKRAPGKLFIGNIADWGAASSLDNLSQQFDGGVIESLAGASYSPETWSGWPEMMRWYRTSLNATRNPRLAIFAVDGDSTDYRLFRYTYTSCLLDDGLFQYQPNNSAAAVAWFDEFEFKLGRALAGPSTTAWKQGVYRRDFENGIVLVNPKGNGAQTIELEGDYRRLSGAQDPVVNNGSVARVLTLQERDGVVLSRISSASRPKPPSNVSVE